MILQFRLSEGREAPCVAVPGSESAVSVMEYETRTVCDGEAESDVGIQ